MSVTLFVMYFYFFNPHARILYNIYMYIYIDIHIYRYVSRIDIEAHMYYIYIYIYDHMGMDDMCRYLGTNGLKSHHQGWQQRCGSLGQ